MATRSKLNQPLDRGTSSTSIRDSGLDPVPAGSIVFLSFCFANSRCLLCIFSISDFICSQLASFSRTFCAFGYSALSYSDRALPDPSRGSLDLFPCSPGPSQVSRQPYLSPFQFLLQVTEVRLCLLYLLTPYQGQWPARRLGCESRWRSGGEGEFSRTIFCVVTQAGISCQTESPHASIHVPG